MDFFKFEGGKETISLDDLTAIILTADHPANLIELCDQMGINLGFAERLSYLWRKKFDEDSDEGHLRKMVFQGTQIKI